MTIRGAREWGYPSDSSYRNEKWAQAYFIDLEMIGIIQHVTMYLPLPLFNGNINSNGFIDKGFFGVSSEYDPVKGQLVFVFNDGSEPTIKTFDDDVLLYRGPKVSNGDWRRPLDILPNRNPAVKLPNTQWVGSITLYKAALSSAAHRGVQYYGVKLGDVISEYVNPKNSEFSVFTDCYSETDGFDSKFDNSVSIQSNGYAVQALKYLDTPKTDEWKYYNLAGTTYAFNSDGSESVAMTGRGLPAAAVSSFSNKGCEEHKVFVAGTLLDDLLFTQEYDVLKKDNNQYDYVSESAVLKISFKL